MCSICGFSICPSSCPNTPEPRAVGICDSCGEDILEGDEYVEIGTEEYHKGCLEDNALPMLLDLYKAKVETSREIRRIGICPLCREEIQPADDEYDTSEEFAVLDGKTYHYECLKDWAFGMLLAVCDASIKTAEDE